MLRENKKYDNDSTHFSYNEYRHKVKKRGNKDITIFISVFIIGLLMILGFVKILSPNVDVGIASEDEYTQYEDDNDYRSSVDTRLKKFQDEDAGLGDEVFTPELDEKIVLPEQNKKTVGAMEAELLNTKTQQHKDEEAHKVVEKVKESIKTEPQKPAKTETPAPQQPVAQAPKAAPAPSAAPSVNAKVVVGYYATDKQAEVAKTIIQEAGLGVVPTVKNMNGYYTLQVGSYSSKEKAQQAANNLLKSNFPARVIVE